MPNTQIDAVDLRSMEDRVRANPAPDDVRLAGVNLLAVLEGGAAIVGPRHLPHPRMALHPFDPETRMKALALWERSAMNCSTAWRKSLCC